MGPKAIADKKATAVLNISQSVAHIGDALGVQIVTQKRVNTNDPTVKHLQDLQEQDAVLQQIAAVIEPVDSQTETFTVDQIQNILASTQGIGAATVNKVIGALNGATE